MTYREAIEFLETLYDSEKDIKPRYPDSLDEYYAFLELLGNPQEGLRGFHIAGTKGKGSTAYILSEILKSQGYRVGLFLSPHIFDIRERIQINGEWIGEADFARHMEKIKPYVRARGWRSVFEILTTMAFLHFKEKEVDFCVFEVGLGGRLDATNVIRVEDGIITSISLDHTHVLGDTVEEIAREKCGIIKEGMRIISQPQRRSVERIIRKMVREKKAGVYFLGEEIPFEVVRASLNGTEFYFADRKYTVSLIGRHQALNVGVALASADMAGVVEDEEKIEEALKNLSFPGRFQILKDDPLIIADGAHNVDSARRLKETVEEVLGENVSLIYGSLRRKDVRGILGVLKDIAKEIYFVPVNSPRSHTPEHLKEEAVLLGISGEVCETLERALSFASRNPPVLITGSLYLCAEAVKLFSAPPVPGRP
ncbi:bifunctional folylpolyglutamate synthase/dihydrofolate synthase [bacterium]|nr:MAG: bifunctional folylpolyglutamate synthase/dihydrofolate synthase [bacterium]